MFGVVTLNTKRTDLNESIQPRGYGDGHPSMFHEVMRVQEGSNPHGDL